MTRGKKKPITLSGIGKVREVTLDPQWVKEWMDVIDLGDFMQEYRMCGSIGGHALTPNVDDANSLRGVMYEYQNAFVVIWFCGEYIDAAYFIKDEDRETLWMSKDQIEAARIGTEAALVDSQG